METKALNFFKERIDFSQKEEIEKSIDLIRSASEGYRIILAMLNELSRRAKINPCGIEETILLYKWSRMIEKHVQENLLTTDTAVLVSIEISKTINEKWKHFDTICGF